MSERGQTRLDSPEAQEAAAAAALRPLLDLARAQLPGGPAAVDARRDPSYLQLRDRLERERLQRVREARRGSRWWLAPAAAALTALLTGGGAYWYTRRPVLSYTVEGSPLAAATPRAAPPSAGSPSNLDQGGYLDAGGGGGTRLNFSDGSRVELQAASGGRVASTSRRGARVLLDHGRARVSVVPRKDGDWIFDAGPCRVQVTGTKFEMNWAERDRVLEVRLEHGSVTVKGPPSPAGVVMHAGQRLLMDVGRGFTRLEPLVASAPAAGPLDGTAGTLTEEAAAEEELDEDELEAPGELPAEEAAGGQTRRLRAGKAAKQDGWSARILAGDFSGVLKAARRRGFRRVLAREDAADVMALAEAARYTRQHGLARRALQTLRARFPESRQADKAAFLLGRMAEDVDGNAAAALAWYERYLTAAPHGAYRDEALGRQLAATLKLSGRASARPLAEAYLRRYPQGAYAEPARAVLHQGE